MLDADNFQHRVEESASVIQRYFRKRNAAPFSCSEKTENVSQSSVENKSDEEETLDSTGKEQKQETDEGENNEDYNYGNIITTAFLAMFGLGMLLFRFCSSCFQKGEDTGGAENAVPDGNMQAQIGTQAAPQTAPVPQPPP